MIKLLSVAILAGFCFASNRATTPPPSTTPVLYCWTDWFDRDNPSGSGDYELLSALMTDYPGQICGSPLGMEAVTTDTNTPASLTGNVFYIFGSHGLVCRNHDQQSMKCRDYKVRFWCPC